MLFKLVLALSLGWSITLSADEMTAEHQQWLKDKFSAQHEKLIPIVAVADMYFACHKAREKDQKQYQVGSLITQMDKNELALRLSDCLNGEAPNSDTALNFGLIGCFHEQLKQLPAEDRAVKQKLVRQAIAKLSKPERQQSFTQCVTDQAVGYLK
ncbi:hypothetical protein tinsulaeT_21590 [Thalassotalea insulae]|uniref:Uncharacterized protein n=1 Tax=Thalassotalea insulae TaxID=2056778 RepID=A0ABQ6GUH6_9GAMM|nr:hypothetical protein [Thalassotalea insulae]GLX78819.1 hypothetical protein tinsulaeT_21590 [Thalassotalea insulae]